MVSTDRLHNNKSCVRKDIHTERGNNSRDGREKYECFYSTIILYDSRTVF